MRHRNVSRSIGLSICLAVGLLLTPVAPGSSGSAEAREGNKTLKLYFGHTKERGEFTFKRNGRYDKKEIARINQFLRDWRRNEPADMDPQLLDLVHAVYKEAGGRDYIHVVSAYRSLKTNNMLRSRSRGVAKTSQHTAGRAMDFYIPGVPLAKLRASAMKFQRGGVGYYPSSGSPFVHVDTGSVRYWPRMPRKQLLALFPNGETLYLPADGKPLPGYDRALARNKSSGGTALAYLETGEEKSGKGKGNWLKRVFSGGADEAEDNEATATAAAPAPAAPAAEPAAPAAQPPAPAGQPVPAAEPAIGEPQILIAAQDAPLDARLPRARPGSVADTMVASLAAELAPQVPAGAQAQTTPAEIPVPRSRPDAQLLAQTLDPGKSTPAPLTVDPEDAIALLSLSAEPEPAPPAPVEVAALSPEAGKAPASEADLAAIDAFTAIDDATSQAARTPDGVSVPRPRPLALAFAGSGLPPADVAVAAETAVQAAPVSVPAAKAPTASAKGNKIAALAQPKAAEPAYNADQDTLRDLLEEPEPAAAPPAPAAPVVREATPKVAPKGDFAGFAMPQPDGTPELFKVPASAQSVAPGPVPSLPTDRFQPTAVTEPAAEESFFSRLFASVVE